MSHKMIYRLPEMRDEDILREYVREHFDNGETTVSASEELAATDYAAWVQMILRNAGTADGHIRGYRLWRKALVGCFKDNLPSAAVIRKNGGILLRENDNFEAGRMSQYYVIHL